MYKEHYYFLLNKPAGYVTSTTDDHQSDRDDAS